MTSHQEKKKSLFGGSSDDDGDSQNFSQVVSNDPLGDDALPTKQEQQPDQETQKREIKTFSLPNAQQQLAAKNNDQADDDDDDELDFNFKPRPAAAAAFVAKPQQVANSERRAGEEEEQQQDSLSKVATRILSQKQISNLEQKLKFFDDDSLITPTKKVPAHLLVENPLNRIPIIIRVITFASYTAQKPLRLAQVSPPFYEAVFDYSALSFVWKGLIETAAQPRQIWERSPIFLAADDSSKTQDDDEDPLARLASAKSHVARDSSAQPNSKGIAGTFFRNETTGNIFFHEDDQRAGKWRLVVDEVEAKSPNPPEPFLASRLTPQHQQIASQNKDRVFFTSGEIRINITKTIEAISRNGSTRHLWYLEKALQSGSFTAAGFKLGIDHATNNNNPKMMEMLMDHFVEQHEEHVVYHWANSQSTNLVPYVLDNGTHKDFSPSILARAVGLGRTRCVAILVEKFPKFIDVNMDEVDGSNTGNNNNSNSQSIQGFPLWRACFDANGFDIVKILIDNAVRCKLDVNKKQQGVNSLFVACQQGNAKIVDYLLNHLPEKIQNDLDVNLRDDKLGMSCVYIASGKLHPTCGKLLLADSRTDISLLTNLNASPLHIAAQETKDDLSTSIAVGQLERGKEVLRLLLKAGFPLNALHTRTGFSPLAAAIAKGNVSAAKILIEEGHADLNWTDPSNPKKDLAKLARETGHHELFDSVLKEKASLGDKLRGLFR